MSTKPTVRERTICKAYTDATRRNKGFCEAKRILVKRGFMENTGEIENEEILSAVKVCRQFDRDRKYEALESLNGMKTCNMKCKWAQGNRPCVFPSGMCLFRK